MKNLIIRKNTSLANIKETLQSIKKAKVHASIVSTDEGNKTFTFDNIDHPYRLIVESMNEGAITLSLDGIILYANQAFAEIVKLPREKIIGRFLEKFIYNKNTLDFFIKNIKKQSCKENFLIKSFDERLVPTLFSASYLEHVDLACIYILVINLTELNSSIQPREITQKPLKKLLDSNIIGIVVSDAHGSIKDANEFFLNLIGYTKKDLLNGIHTNQITPKKYQNLFQKTIKSLPNGNRSVTFEKEYIHKTGKLVSALVSATILDKAKEEIIAFVIDLTEQKLAEEKIKQQASLLNITRDAIIVYNFENIILFWNKAAEKIYGWPSHEVVEKADYSELFKSEQINYNDLLQILLTDGYWEKELELLTKNNNKITVECRLTLVFDSKNVPISILAVHTDITKKKKLESQFLQAQRLESLGSLASGIAHDLNNILAPILMSTNLLKKQISPEKRASVINIIENVTLRGADLIKQILAFAKGTKSEFPTISIKQILVEIEKILLQTFPKSINISFNITHNLSSIIANATQIHQLLLNLAINARDAMPEGGKIEITAENIFIDKSCTGKNSETHHGNYVLISVKDTGTGIAPEHIDKIFDPFFTTKEHGKGTGLGLSTVNIIANQHKGFVKVSSELKKGTIIKVYLPASNLLTSEEFQINDEKILHGQDKLILIVDDELSIQQITQASLENVGYRTLIAANGIEAVGIYAQNKNSIDLVITDMVMPVMDGLVMLEIMEKLNPNVKVIISSGITCGRSTESVQSCVKAFLPKPYTVEELLKTVSSILSLDDQAFNGSSFKKQKEN
ncbi:MAG: PAS domain S-box protein [Blastocatellia bacterium]